MRSWIALILTLLVAFAGISQAQGVIPSHPRPFLCTPGSCSYPPPTISISPGTETVTNSKVFVTIIMCDTVVLGSDTVYLNGGVITSQFTRTTSSAAGCHVKWTLTDTVTLSLGTNTLTAEVQGENTNGTGLQQTSSSVTYTYQQPAHTATVTVSPDTAVGTVGTTTTTNFTVTNTGNVTDTLWFTRQCSGSIFTLCNPVSVDSAVLLSGHNTTVSVQWKPGTAGANGTVNLTATENNGAAASAVQTVVTVAAPGLDFVDANPGVSYNRGNCLTIAMAPSAAFECLALRITHPLPSVRTMTSTKVPTLIYNWDFSQPIQRVGALLTIGAQDTATLDSVRARLYKRPHGTGAYVIADSSSWWRGSDWPTTATTTRRLEDYWAATDTTGYYDLAFATTRYYHSTAHGNWTAQDSSSGQIINVNRMASPYGAGWWLVGLERLMFYGTGTRPDTIVWIGGDGSTNMYVDAMGAGQLWQPVKYVGARDSIMYSSSLNMFVRMAPHNTQIRFANNIAHPRMQDRVNRLGQKTHFHYTDSTSFALDSIEVWTPHQDSLTQTWYTFIYSSGVLSQVKAPGPAGAGTRVVTFTDSSTYSWASNSIWKIKDPDGDSILFGRDPNALLRYDVRIDKRGDSTIYGYGLDVQGFGYSRRPLHTSGVSDITRTLLEYENMGLSVGWMSRSTIFAMPPESAYVQYQGPRYNSNAGHDSSDVTTIWVDKWWQPTKARDAHGHFTTIRRDNPTYPTRVTQTVDPLGRIDLAAYDARGNVDSITDLGTYLNGKYAVAAYQWLPAFDYVTSVHLPAGEMDSTAYDSTWGNRKWTQDKRSSSRVNFSYDATTEMLRSVTDARGDVDSIRYDGTLGNDSTHKSPIGFVTTFLTDKIGRDTLTKAPVDAAQDTVSAVRTVYDAMDRADSVFTITPYTTSTTTNADTVVVATTYDPEGAPLSVARRINPDPASIGTLTTSATYDAAGRKIRDYAVDGKYDSLVYDAASNVVQTLSRRKDANGRRYQVNNIYDALNRLVLRTTDSVFYASIRNWMDTTAAHDSDNSIVHDSFPAFHTTQATGYTVRLQSDTLGYDARGSLVLADNPDARVHRTYNLDGTLATDSLYIRTVAGTNFTTHAYGMSFTYDREGRRTLLSSDVNLMLGSGTIQYSYDTLGTGQLAQIVDQFGKASTYSYDSTYLLVRRTTPGYQQIDYGYDADGRLSGDTATLVSDPIGTTVDTAHDDATLRAEVIQYNARGQVVSAANSHENKESITQHYTPGGQASTGTRNSSMSLGPRSWTAQTTQETSTVDLFGNQLYDSLETSHQAYQNIGGYSGSSAIPIATGSTYQHGTGRLATQAYRDALGLQSGLPFFGSGDQMVVTYDSEGNRVAMLLSATGQENDYTNQTFYYGADNKLRASDASQLAGKVLSLPIMSRTFEEYRYDALGRRILVYTRRACENGSTGGCVANIVRRTVWDGASELVDIQMPDTSSLNLIENDVAPVGAVVAKMGPYAAQGFCITTGYYGRTIYINGPALDEPVEFVRVDFEEDIGSAGVCSNGSATHYAFGPLVYSPIYDWQGHAKEGTLANGAAASKDSVFGTPLYAQPPWIDLADNYHRVQTGADAWWGKVATENADGSGLLYRRHRYYDPNSGQFTQEDPIGLAGGLSAYGFANGDPVNYSDPFGLCPDPNKPWCSSPGYAILRFFGVSDATADKIGRIFYGGAMIAGAPGMGEGARAAGEALGAAAANPEVTTSFGKKIEAQLDKRGWTKDDVNGTIANPDRTVATTDSRYQPDGTRLNDPATAYVNKDGSYVVRNNKSGDIVQISNRNDPNWKSPF
jgi:RHS repeat-associated protein